MSVYDRFEKAMSVFKGMTPPPLLQAVTKVTGDSFIQFDVGGEDFYFIVTEGKVSEIGSGYLPRNDYRFIMDVPTFEGLLDIMETYREGSESETAIACARYFIEKYDIGLIKLDSGLAKRIAIQIAVETAKRFL
jgi:hypothetical protein